MTASLRVLVLDGGLPKWRLREQDFAGMQVTIEHGRLVPPSMAGLREQPPDLLVIEADKADFDWLGVCQSLKIDSNTAWVPILVISSVPALRGEAIAAGVDEFVLTKSDRRELLTKVDMLLREGSTRRKLTLQMVTNEVRLREQIRAAFRRYFSPRLAERMLADLDLNAAVIPSQCVRTRAAVMFADMRGFTALAERVGPSEIVQLLNEYFSLLTDIAFHYDGTVFSMAGDSLMVGYGVPVAQEDSTERAIQTASAMLSGFRSLAEKWKRLHEIDVGLGIGINAGEVVAGNVGSEHYMNYTIVGDTVNVASRLSQRARAGEMLFSESVKKALEEHGYPIEAVALPPLTLRGRSGPMDIFCVPLQERVNVSSAA